MTERPQSAVLQVFIFKNGEYVGADLFSEQQVLIGRDPSVADLVLESSQVSRKHALIEHDGVKVVIRDAGSTNGIFLNNKRIDSTELTRLDEVVVGEFSLKVKLVARGKPEEMVSPATRAVPVAAQARPEPARQPAGREPDDLGASTRDDDLPPPAMRAEAPKPDLSEWDDLPSKRMAVPSREELRGRSAAAAKQRLGDVLSDLGIDRPRGAGSSSDSRRPPAAVEEESTALEDDDRLVGDAAGQPAGLSALDDDDDDEDARYDPPYSLVAQLLQEDAAVATERGGEVCVEAIAFRGDTVIEAHLLRPGESFWIGPEIGFWLRRKARDLPPRVRLLRYRKSGDCRVEMHKQVQGTLKRGQERLKLDQIEGMSKNARRGTMMMGMRSGEVLDVVDGGTRYHVRFVRPPQPIRDDEPALARMQPSGLTLKSIGSSVGVHLVGLIALGLLLPKDFTPTTLQANDDFVEVKVEAAPQLEAPPEEKPKEEEKANEKVPPNMEAKPSRKKPKPGGTSAAPAGVLGLLSKRGSSAAPGPAAAVAAVSNLTAARVPGASGGYRVSGLIGKLPTSSLSVGGGGGGLMTKGGASLLRGGAGGGGLVRGSGTRGVGGLVQKNPGAMRSVGQGTLDRDEIQKVINQNISQIQRCYERELLKKPGLSGKVQVEWTIATSGKVRQARQTYTSMQSTEVANCIMGAIRTWVFPQPKGGEVIVNYPFIFKSIGF